MIVPGGCSKCGCVVCVCVCVCLCVCVCVCVCLCARVCVCAVGIILFGQTSILLLPLASRAWCTCNHLLPEEDVFPTPLSACVCVTGIHRSMGTHISKVRSIALDSVDISVLEVHAHWRERARRSWRTAAHISQSCATFACARTQQ